MIRKEGLMGISIKNDEQIDIMRKAGQIVAKTHELLEKEIKIGMSTSQLNEIAEEYILSCGAVPSFKGYNDFPAGTCISINDEIIHGIPGKRVIQDGDVVSIDIGAYFNGFHGDAARTWGIGNISDIHKKLIEVTKQSFFEGIKFAKNGNHLHQICGAIESYVLPFGFSLVRDYTGHGIGKSLHEAPQIPNYKPRGRGVKLAKGMALAIEPMVNVGFDSIVTLKDDWTIVTKDGKCSAHYENTIMITDGEPEILTLIS
jgi:methionyl aminopeptidase